MCFLDLVLYTSHFKVMGENSSLNLLLTDNAWDQELLFPRQLNHVELDYYMGNFSRRLDRVIART